MPSIVARMGVDFVRPESIKMKAFMLIFILQVGSGLPSYLASATLMMSRHAILITRHVISKDHQSTTRRR